MKIQVTATHREGLSGVWTPQTLWPSATPVSVEVVDSDEDPPCAARTAANPGIVAFDGYQIGRRTLALLRRTDGLIIAGEDATNAVDVAAKFGAAEKAWAEERAQFVATIATLTEEVARLRPLEAAAREQEGTIADLRARIGRSQQAAQGQPSGKQAEQRR